MMGFTMLDIVGDDVALRLLRQPGKPFTFRGQKARWTCQTCGGDVSCERTPVGAQLYCDNCESFVQGERA